MTKGFVTFWLGTEEYAFDVDHVVEIMRLSHLTPVPGASDELAGVINWRGRTIPVLELAARLKRPASSPDERRGRLLVLRTPAPFAVRVDRAGELISSSVATPIEGVAELAKENIRLVQLPRGVLRILDPASLVGAGARLMEERTG